MILYSCSFGQNSHKYAQCCSKLWVGLVRLWQVWARHLSLIPLTGLMHLYDELTMRFYRYSHNVQSYTVAFLVNIATKLLNFAPNWGLAWHSVARLDNKYVFDLIPKTRAPLCWTNNEYVLVFLSCMIVHRFVFGWNSHKHTQFCFKIWVWGPECWSKSWSVDS